jgi:hypothetical protein
MPHYSTRRPSAKPSIYAFASTHQDYGGLLKVGYTEGNPLKRIKHQSYFVDEGTIR